MNDADFMGKLDDNLIARDLNHKCIKFSKERTEIPSTCIYTCRDQSEKINTKTRKKNGLLLQALQAGVVFCNVINYLKFHIILFLLLESTFCGEKTKRIFHLYPCLLKYLFS